MQNLDMRMMDIVNKNAVDKREERIHKLASIKRQQLNNQKRRKQKSVKSIISVLKGVCITLSLMYLAWVVLSYFNIVLNNTSPGATERIWGHNYFTMILEYIGQKL